MPIRSKLCVGTPTVTSVIILRRSDDNISGKWWYCPGAVWAVTFGQGHFRSCDVTCVFCLGLLYRIEIERCGWCHCAQLVNIYAAMDMHFDLLRWPVGLTVVTWSGVKVWPGPFGLYKCMIRCVSTREHDYVGTRDVNRVTKTSGPKKCADRFGNRSVCPKNSDTFRSACRQFFS